MVVEKAVVDKEETKVDDTQKEQVKDTVDSVKEDAGAKIKIGEEEVLLSDVQSWKEDSTNKSKWQKDLTEKGQKLSEDTKGLDRFREMAGFIDSPDNKDKAAKILAIVNGEEEKLPPKDEDEDPAITELRKDLKDAKKIIKSIQDNASEKDKTGILKDIEREVKEVKAKYSDLDDEDIDTIQSMAIANNGENLLKVAEKYVKKLDAMKKKHIKTYLDAKEEDKGSFVETKGVAAPSPPGKLSIADGSAKKAFAAHLKELTKD